MPKTKTNKKRREILVISKKSTVTLDTSVENNNEDEVKMLIFNFEKDFLSALCTLKSRLFGSLDTINCHVAKIIGMMNEKDRKKTIREYKTEKLFSAWPIEFSNLETMVLKQVNTTAVKNKKKQTEDEGYLTISKSGNRMSNRPQTRSSSSSRQNRPKQRLINNRRYSRSLSRSRINKTTILHATEKQTPKNATRALIVYGMVTPKIRPNMPVSILRRPKLGEMAISMQGSPLLVSGVAIDSCANVNIPMNDGEIVSLQSCSKLRVSEIPDIDETTRQQLTTLRDHLNKFVDSQSFN